MIMNMLRYYSIFMVLFVMYFAGCSSTAPLPATLNIVPPASNLSSEVAAFSGIWDGKWNGYLETILVVEKIDRNEADVIMSLGLDQGFKPRYSYYTAHVGSPSSIEWTMPNGDRFIFKMDKGLNKIYGTFIEKKTGANEKGYFHRREVK